MYYVTIDCGTTNSRAYVVDRDGKIRGKATKMVGVRDTATTGSRDKLRAGVCEIVARAIENAGVSKCDISAVLSSGMITSEIGLCEIPHAMAPCGEDELASSITRADDMGILDGVPVYFVRGIKNKMVSEEKRPYAQVGELDFMRGEETQVAGILTRPDVTLPATVVVLSSHTKFICLDVQGMVLGSITTLSGQLYDAILNNTFVGKSVEKREDRNVKPNNYFDEQVVLDAYDWIQNVGLVRALMFPRFLDVLLKTRWYERALFYDALVAAEDMLAIRQLKLFDEHPSNNFYLVGNDERCKLYEYLLKRNDPGANITSITDVAEIDALSILGVLKIASKAGIIK
ncbi:MAG: 2-dehydro-3-deoxygalactonokinase [Clostridia bacterium]